MAEVQVVKWNKTIPNMEKQDIIRFQFMVHCYIQKTSNISPALLDCLTLLGTLGSAELLPFCELLTGSGVFQSIQSSRNAITRLQDKGLIIKEGKNKKLLKINPELKIQNKGNVLVDIKCFSPNKETVS
jgi:hypothetical protein